jgi:hypothetical protein
MSIHRKGSFQSVLAATDILASYSSTAIDEALLNQVPVLLYDKWNRYNHFQRPAFQPEPEALALPVCYVNQADTLGKALARMADELNANENDVDYSPYRYDEDYSVNFTEFIQSIL